MHGAILSSNWITCIKKIVNITCKIFKLINMIFKLSTWSCWRSCWQFEDHVDSLKIMLTWSSTSTCRYEKSTFNSQHEQLTVNMIFNNQHELSTWSSKCQHDLQTVNYLHEENCQHDMQVYLSLLSW